MCISASPTLPSLYSRPILHRQPGYNSCIWQLLPASAASLKNNQASTLSCMKSMLAFAASPLNVSSMLLPAHPHECIACSTQLLLACVASVKNNEASCALVQVHKLERVLLRESCTSLHCLPSSVLYSCHPPSIYSYYHPN